MKIIGREKEIKLLEQVISSKQAEFVAVYGRRRVGKTYLIQSAISKLGIYMECSGVKDGSMKDQLFNFNKSLMSAFYPEVQLNQPENWREAFETLTNAVKKLPQTQKVIIFLDELPWLATNKSLLLQNIDYMWNSEWSKMPNFKLIVCGSAASWVLENLINAKGGLYNRITKSILLKPFTLGETKQFLEYKKIRVSHQQVLDIYMVMGGVPFYLNQLDNSKSLAQIINDLCFQKSGLLYEEFPRLFRSLFDNAELNLHIVKEIGFKRYGVSFAELTEKTGKKAGGRFQERLDELEASGFIEGFLPYGKKQRGRYYKVIDPYVSFYLKWIAPFAQGKSVPKGKEYWLTLSSSPAWNSWAGYSFELICYSHIEKIIKALNLDGVICQISDWRYQPIKGQEETGAQIDLVIDRSDGAVTLCEIKYSGEAFAIDKNCAKNLINKHEIFEKQLKQPKQIFWAIITSSDFKENMWSEDLINGVVKLKDLFYE